MQSKEARFIVYSIIKEFIMYAIFIIEVDETVRYILRYQIAACKNKYALTEEIIASSLFQTTKLFVSLMGTAMSF